VLGSSEQTEDPRGNVLHLIEMIPKRVTTPRML
jgi:hypothetical protein